jgi:hypothetical protein
MPINIEDFMLHQLVGSLQEEPKILENRSVDYNALLIGRVLILVSLERLKVVPLSISWKKL